MSAVESAQQAARLGDPIGHSPGLSSMMWGACVGALVGALLVAAAVASGGALLIALAVCGAAACVAGGALSAAQLVRGIRTAAGLPYPTTGVIATGSQNVRIGRGRRKAASAVLNRANTCTGGFLQHSAPKIAEGAATVLINGHHAARVGNRLTCAAVITQGCDTVIIGGPTVQKLEVDDWEAFFETGFTWMLWGALAGAFVLTIGLAGAAAAAGGAGWLAIAGAGALAAVQFTAISALFMGGFAALGAIGNWIGPGWGDILQGAVGLGSMGLGVKRAKLRERRALRKAANEELKKIQPQVDAQRRAAKEVKKQTKNVAKIEKMLKKLESRPKEVKRAKAAELKKLHTQLKDARTALKAAHVEANKGAGENGMLFVLWIKGKVHLFKSSGAGGGPTTPDAQAMWNRVPPKHRSPFHKNHSCAEERSFSWTKEAGLNTKDSMGMSLKWGGPKHGSPRACCSSCAWVFKNQLGIEDATIGAWDLLVSPPHSLPPVGSDEK